MQKLMRKELVNYPDYNTSREVESCTGGKQCKNSFKLSETESSAPLELMHSSAIIRSMVLAMTRRFVQLRDKNH